MDTLNICLVGHRGTGKTSFLKRIDDRATIDLDEEITRVIGRNPGEIFADAGEAEFRRLERACLDEVLARPGRKVVAVGAGYDGPRPDARIVWLRRDSDAAGRIFLDRPRLNVNAAPLDEYAERFAVREARYRAWADQCLTLPEGYDGGLEDVLDGAWSVPFDVTLRPGYRPGFRPRRIELRDDLTPGARAQDFGCRVLTSYRASGGAHAIRAAGDEDWALELGPPPRSFGIVSVHAGDVRSGIARLASAPAAVAKLAVEVRTFAELMAGHRWWQADPNGRAFLPRSADGRWRWYRSLFGPRMPLHFVREDEGTSPDQPLLWQTRLQPEFKCDFAAVLGAPVAHSRTPIEQRAFFAARAMPVVAVDVNEDEWPAAWPILRELGLIRAAVTAPLKTRACAVCDHLDPATRALGSVNTLAVDARGAVTGTNTDVIALRELARGTNAYKEVWLWGGGGVKAAVLSAWPHAREISARAGPPAGSPQPDLVIWAVGRARHPMLPPPTLRPRLILDLNYADDSPAREWAARDGVAYRSGLDMFTAQARAQRAFWTACERREDRARESIR